MNESRFYPKSFCYLLLILFSIGFVSTNCARAVFSENTDTGINLDQAVSDAMKNDTLINDVSNDLQDDVISVDQSIDATIPPSPPVFDWVKTFGGAGQDYGYSVAVDRSGNVYIAGNFEGTVDFGGGSVTSQGGSDAFVTSFDSSGVHRWQKTIGGVGNEQSWAIAIDPSDNVYLSGLYSDSVDLGGGIETSHGQSDVFWVSYTSSGVHRWQQVVGGVDLDACYDVATDGNGNIYLTGWFNISAELGGNAETSKGMNDIFLTSFSNSGVHRWQKALGGVDSDMGKKLVVDHQNNVYLVGKYEGAAELGGGTENSQGGEDIFITSFDSSGVHRWQKSLGGTGSDDIFDVAVDSTNNIYLTGSFASGTADLGGGSVISTSVISDVYLTSFDSNGTHRWQKVLTASGVRSEGLAIAIDRSDNVYNMGYFDGLANLGGGTETCNDSSDVYIASFDSSGTHRWQQVYNAGPRWSLAIDQSHNLYRGGSFSGTVDFGGGDVTSNGGSDIVLVKYKP